VYTSIGRKLCADSLRYDVGKLVWFEIYDDAVTAIAREKD